jgi:hypothetical protein
VDIQNFRPKNGTNQGFCKIPIKDLNIFDRTVFCIKDLISFSIIGLKYIANKVGTVYEVDT